MGATVTDEVRQAADEQHDGPKAPAARDDADQRSWLVRHRWKFGLATAGLLGGLWWQRSRKKRIVVDRVSHDWLVQHEVEAGKDQVDI
jgi:hypothetical protein